MTEVIIQYINNDVLLKQGPTNQVIINDNDTDVTVETSETIVVIETPGPQGPPGPTGGGSFYYLHTQGTPSTSWTVNHNLGAVPNVSVLVGGVTVSGVRIDHASNNQTVITLNIPSSGKAVFS